MVAYADREALERTLVHGPGPLFQPLPRKPSGARARPPATCSAWRRSGWTATGTRCCTGWSSRARRATRAPAPASRRPSPAGTGKSPARGGAGSRGHLLSRLAGMIDARAAERPEGSYTARLLDCRDPEGLAEGWGGGGRAGGRGERARTMPGSPRRSADLLYHLLVLLQARGVPLDAVLRELDNRMPVSRLVVHAFRPSPHPQRVLPPRRRQPHPRPGGARQEAGHGQPGGHRPRQPARRLDLLRGGQGRRRSGRSSASRRTSPSARGRPSEKPAVGAGATTATWCCWPATAPATRT